MTSYRLLLILFSPLILGHILWLSVRERQLRYFTQRTGLSRQKLPPGALWFHCASVGEVNTLLPLLQRLRRERPGLPFIITTNTTTSARIVGKQQLPLLFHHYLPFDWRFGLKRFLRKNRPSALYVMETEIWPNLFELCRRHAIPVSIINARLSDKTLSASPWARRLLKKALLNVQGIHARSTQDAEKYRQLGAPAERIETAGNLKLTTAMPDSDAGRTAGEADDRPPRVERDYVLLCSTHADEEKQIADIWATLRRPELLIIAPRHPERGGAIARQLADRKISMRSRNQPIDADTDIFLLDSIGELSFYFAQAKLVIMGGSFVPVGGHNILEPAAFHRAVITGPFMQNFAEELALMLEHEAIVQLPSLDTLGDNLKALLDDSDRRRRLEDNSRKLKHDIEAILDTYCRLLTA